MGLFSGVEFLRFVESPGWTVDVDDDGMMYHAVDGGCGYDGIAEVIAEFFEVDVRCYDGRAFAVTAIDHLVEEIGVSCVMLFEAVEADFVNQQDFGAQKKLEFLFEGVIGQRRQEFTKHR